MRLRLFNSFLRSRPLYRVAVIALLVVLGTELWSSVRQLSQTFDEGAHLYAGYRNWRGRDFGVNPEHPPLVKLVAAAPLLTLSLKQPQPPTMNFKFEEYAGGAQLLYANNADALLWRARLAASVFSFALALLVFAAGYEMFGPIAALFALFLYVFEPNLLAHGALVTTDMGVTCFLFASVYAFYRYVKHPGLVRLIVCGLAAGLALAAKFSALIIFPMLAVCALGEALFANQLQHTPADSAARRLGRGAVALRLLGALAAVGLVAWTVLWAFYTFRFQARPGSAQSGSAQSGAAQLAPDFATYAGALHPGARAAILGLARWHLLPQSYLFGLADLLQPLSPTHWYSSFLLGRLYPGPVWFYFPVALLIKLTIPFLLLLITCAVLQIHKRAPFRRELLYLLVPVVLFLAGSMNAPFDIGIRHVLPVFPFLILLAALGAWSLARWSRVGAYAVAALLTFHAASSLAAFPNYIPYSNEAFGGSSHTYRALNDSNVDWGQDLKQLHMYLANHHISDCWFAHSSELAVRAAAFDIPCRPLPVGLAHGFLSTPLIPPVVNGIVLLNTNEISGLGWGGGDLNPYRQFQSRRPDAVIAGSTLLFRGSFDMPLAAAQTHAGLANFLLRQNRPDNALQQVQIAAQLAPESPEIQADLGGVLMQTGRKAEAGAAFQRAAVLARTHDPEDFLHTRTAAASLTR